MKQTLQLRLGQHLTMTPQLQQAIKLLQLSALELHTEIQEALDSNLMLELAEEGDSDTSNTHSEEANPSSSQESNDDNLDLQQSEIPDDLPVDTAWEDIYDSLPIASSQSGTEVNGREFEAVGKTNESLHEHLSWQLNLTLLSKTDKIIAESIIDSINEDGYLSCSCEEIYRSLGDELDIEPDEVEAVLHRIQNFDPPGIAARGLKENLLLQLKQVSIELPWKLQALDLIENHFDLLAQRDYMQLMRRTKLSNDDLGKVINLIQTLNPRPGSQITDSSPEYIIPDVTVKKAGGKWKVELNMENTPRLRISPHYAGLLKRVNNRQESSYMKNHLQEARWFLKCLNSRNETLLKVATCIVERQRAFLEYGEEAMKALVLHDVAEEVGMHESTISRVTTRKYMHTPRGIFELKYFFSSHVSTESGGQCSATAIRALIKKLIAAEKPKKPLSDSKIAALLSEQGIKVARRTVAKYREALAILPSNERKRFI